MTTKTLRYADNAARFGALVSSVSADDWSRASPCEGWTAADVLDHVVDTQRDFLAGRGADLAARPSGEPAATWNAHHRTVWMLLRDDGFAATEYAGYFGPTTVADTMRSFYGWDLVVHRWDIGSAAGRDVELSTEELALVEDQLPGFGEMLYSDGICRPALAVADDADRQTRVLAALGRAHPWNP
ncbi:MAG: maleylpyruvate isomerase family mycothiol-dependent enzyme [Microlunatus sp.]|nr:maleylpyruvate isomerase family mycothiol-dependent enzyme [Microlunatus sp.]